MQQVVPFVHSSKDVQFVHVMVAIAPFLALTPSSIIVREGSSVWHMIGLYIPPSREAYFQNWIDSSRWLTLQNLNCRLKQWM